MPIFTAIATAISGLLFGGSLLAAKIIAGVLAFGTKLAVSYLNRSKKRKYSAVQGESQLGGDVPAGALYGQALVKGQRVFYAKWGSGNRFNAEVFLLANGWCDGIEPEVRFYGETHLLEPRTIIGNEAAHYGVLGFGNLISIRFYDGRPGQLADTKLVADTALLGRSWKATARGTGLTYVVIEREYDSEKFEKGRPEFEFVLRGLREYDPRKDSTVAGGSGAHRLADPTTWAFTRNPVIHRLNYQLGLRGLVSGRTIIGEGKTLGQLDLGSYFAAANVADTPRNGKGLYECSLFVNADDDHTEILKEFDDAVAGYGMNRRGLSGIVAGAPQIPVLEITADDIPAGRAKEVQRRKSAFELINHLAGQFTSPEAGWQPESLTPIKVNADVAADGRLRQISNDFLQVTDAKIAQYLLTIRYRQNRRGGSATLPVSRRVGLAVQEGEWVTWAGTDWLVTGWQADAQFRFTLQLAETSAEIYDDGDIEPGPVVIPPAPTINPSLLSTVQNFDVEVGTIEGGGGHEVPALRFTWDPPADPTITEVRFFYRIQGKTQLFEDRSTEPEDGEHVTTNNVQPMVVYQAQATITTVPDRFKTYTEWKTTAATPAAFYPIDLEQLGDDVTALLDGLDAGIGAVATNLAAEALARASGDAAEASARGTALAGEATARIAGLAAEAAARAGDLATEASARTASVNAETAARIADASALADRLRSAFDELGDLGTVLAEQDYANYADKQQLRTEIQTARDDLTASYTLAITTAVGEGSAIVSRFEALEVESELLAAAISSESLVRTDAIAALAQQVTLLSAGSDDQFDWSSIWYFNTTVEGFTGNGAPTVTADGYLRPANHATDPYVISPAAIGADGSLYRQVRARIRKIGAPVWEGYLWWMAEGDATWDAARRVSFAEPAFASGYANITINVAWSGSIGQIRLDLSSAQSDSDRYEIDWIAVGRPSPGASSAQLVAEQQARTAADAVLAGDITALSASLGSLDGTVAGQAGAISSLETSVTGLGDDVEALATALDAVEATIPGLATASALAALSAEVDSIGVGGLVSNADALIALRNEVGELGALVAEGMFASHEGEGRLRTALAEVYQHFTTTIEATDAQVELNAAAITAALVQLGDKANASSVSELSSTVTAQGDAISALSTALDTVEATLPGLATSSALSALDTRVTAAEGTLSTQGSSLTTVQAELTTARNGQANLDARLDGIDTAVAGKASSSALSALDTRVTAAEGTLSTQGSAITAVASELTAARGADASLDARLDGIDSTVAGKASSSALSTLDTRVTAAEGTLSTQGSSLTAVQSELTTARNGQANLDARLDGIDTTVAGKASSSALSALDTRVTAAEGTLSTQGSSLTAVQSELTTARNGQANLDARLDGIDTTVAGKASSSALSALDTRVTAAEGSLSTQGSSLTAVQSELTTARNGQANLDARLDGIDTTVAGKASSSALSALDTRVTAAEGTLSTQGSSLTAVQSEISTARNGQANLDARLDGIDTAVAGKASSSALSALDTRVTAAEGSLSTQGSSLTAVQSELTTARNGQANLDARLDGIDTTVAGKASSSALSALDTRVTAAEGTLSTQGSSLTAVQSELTTARNGQASLDARLDGIDGTVAGKASSSALSALDTRVTAAEGTLSTQGSSLTAVQSELTTARNGAGSLDARLDGIDGTVAGKASSSALSALDTRVTAAEGTLSTQGSSLTAVQSELTTARNGAGSLDARLDGIDGTVAGKASASALSALSSTVTSQGDAIYTLSEAVTAVDAEVDGMSASGKFRTTAEVTPAGALARVGVSVAASGGGSTSQAALFLDAISGGISRIIAVSDRFLIADPDDLANLKEAFLFEDGAMYVPAAYIRDLTIDNLTLGGLTYEAFPSQELTRTGDLSGSRTGTASAPNGFTSNTWVDIATIATGVYAAAQISGNFGASVIGGTGGFVSGGSWRIVVGPTNSIVAEAPSTLSSGTTAPQSSATGIKTFFLPEQADPLGSIKLQAKVSAMGGTGAISATSSMAAMWFRR